MHGQKNMYTGYTECTFKCRRYNHNSAFELVSLRGRSNLTGHLWNLKEKKKINSDPIVR